MLKPRNLQLPGGNRQPQLATPPSNYILPSYHDKMSLCRTCRILLRRSLQVHRQQNLSTSTKPSPAEILSKPTWSVRSLREPSLTSAQTSTSTTTQSSASPETVTTSQLHHLLRLAALPMPKSSSEEATMISTLQDQLHFVRAIQRVNTNGVEPLRAIQDETLDGVHENTITLADMEHLLATEEHVGHYKRARRVRRKIDNEQSEKWDVLGTAGRKAGRYFVVESS